jgi:hypothetical protein
MRRNAPHRTRNPEMTTAVCDPSTSGFRIQPLRGCPGTTEAGEGDSSLLRCSKGFQQPLPTSNGVRVRFSVLKHLAYKVGRGAIWRVCAPQD